MAVRILGIDPGTLVFGFACLEVRSRLGTSARAAPTALALRARNVVAPSACAAEARLLEAGAVRLGRGQAIAARLGRLAVELEALLERLEPTELALEEAFAGKSIQSALRIGEARGVVLATAHRRGVAIHQFPPARIKRAVAGHGGASKAVVAAMACRAVGFGELDGPADVGDALAVALCRHEQRLTPVL